MSTSPAKKSVMNARKHVAVEVTPVNKAHEIYLFVKKYPGLTEAEYRKGLVGSGSGITSADINSALKQFVSTGRMTETQRGRGDNRYSVYEVDLEVEYIPRAVMRKVAPNDKKALQAVARKTAKMEDPFLPQIATNPISEVEKQPAAVTDISTQRAKRVKKQSFEMIEGLAAIDPNHPGFQETAQEILSKVTPTEVPKEQGPVKPILEAMFFNVGNQSVTATPQQLRQLYDELHAIFGQK